MTARVTVLFKKIEDVILDQLIPRTQEIASLAVLRTTRKYDPISWHPMFPREDVIKMADVPLEGHSVKLTMLTLMRSVLVDTQAPDLPSSEEQHLEILHSRI
jgi:hypothetical protein